MITQGLAPAAICFAALGLGARHALDADHLTAIDAMVRRSANDRPILAALSGVLFSLGHGSLVVAIAIATVWFPDVLGTPPAWLQWAGSAIAATILLLLGGINLRAALRAEPDSPVHPVGWKARIIPRFDGATGVIATGVLFAISFDTVAIATGIGLLARASAEPWVAFPAAGAFTLAMMAVGGLNGFWVLHLLKAAVRFRNQALRTMTFSIGALNLILGGLVIGSMLSFQLAEWRDRTALAATCVVLLACAATYTLSRMRWRRATPQA